MGNAKRDRTNDTDGRHKSVKSNRPIKVPFAEFRFVRIELTEPEKDEFRKLRDSGEFDTVDVDHWAKQGYKLSVSYDDQHNSIIVSLTAQYRDMDNSGLILTGRGASYASALGVLEYKDKYLCGDVGWLAAESGRGGSYGDIG